MSAESCENCGGPLESEYATKYCSQDCFHEGHSFAGENNPNFNDGMVSTQYRICDAKFEYYPSDKKGLYCSDCVENEQWREPPDIHGAANPRWSGGRIETECEACGAAIRRYPSDFTSQVALCSDECRAMWLSSSFTGEGHPNWKGGGNEDYGKGRRRARDAALERDDYRCRVCGSSKEDLGRNPDVHHIVPIRSFIKFPEASRMDAHTLTDYSHD